MANSKIQIFAYTTKELNTLLDSAFCAGHDACLESISDNSELSKEYGLKRYSEYRESVQKMLGELSEESKQRMIKDQSKTGNGEIISFNKGNK